VTTTTGVTVTGTGTVSSAPDRARLDLAAEVTAASVDAAVRQAATAIAAMRAALTDRGVEPADLGTSHVAVHPDYRHDRGPRGYAARFALSATLRDVESIGAVAQAGLAAGGDAARLDGLSFHHADPSVLRRAAREAAFAEATAAAEQFAQLAGQQIGVIEEITEQPARDHGPVVPLRFAAAQGDSGIAVDPGELEVSVVLTVRWAWA
jgi:uncharacterized protein